MITKQDLTTLIDDKSHKSKIEKRDWRLLYCPISRIARNSGIALIGLNPGGSDGECEVDVPGCAYLDEEWGRTGQNPLQVQVQRLFQEVATAIGHPDGNRLLAGSLTGNLVPFRSKRWNHLPAKASKPLVEFGATLWRDILNEAKPQLVIALSSKVSDALLHAFEVTPAYSEHDTQWGKVRWRIQHTPDGCPFSTIIALPHLSTFRVFGRGSKDFDTDFQEACRKALL